MDEPAGPTITLLAMRTTEANNNPTTDSYSIGDLIGMLCLQTRESSNNPFYRALLTQQTTPWLHGPIFVPLRWAVSPRYLVGDECKYWPQCVRRLTPRRTSYEFTHHYRRKGTYTGIFGQGSVGDGRGGVVTSGFRSQPSISK